MLLLGPAAPVLLQEQSATVSFTLSLAVVSFNFTSYHQIDMQ